MIIRDELGRIILVSPYNPLQEDEEEVWWIKEDEDLADDDLKENDEE